MDTTPVDPDLWDPCYSSHMWSGLLEWCYYMADPWQLAMSALSLHLGSPTGTHIALRVCPTLLWCGPSETGYISSAVPLIDPSQEWAGRRERERRCKFSQGRASPPTWIESLKNVLPCVASQNFLCDATKHPLMEHRFRFFLLHCPVPGRTERSWPTPGRRHRWCGCWYTNVQLSSFKTDNVERKKKRKNGESCRRNSWMSVRRKNPE